MKVPPINHNKPVVSVIITAHAESILIHRTLASVQRAIKEFDTDSAEIILHIDNPTPDTSAYIDAHKKTSLKQVRIFTNYFGDLGASRNFAIKQAAGKYISTIDADDIMSKRWLVGAVDYLESSTETTVAHSEYTVEFEGADSLVIKHGEIDYDTDTLLSVYANRWNSVIVAPRKVLLKNPYTPNSPGYGYEDWNLNCRLIYSKVHNILIPGTAIFVRRKRSDSEWARQTQSMSVLQANPLLAFGNVRKVIDTFHKAPTLPTQPSTRYQTLEHVKATVKKYPIAYKAAKYLKHSLKRQDATTIVSRTSIPRWLQDEWRELHSIDRQIFPTKNLMKTIPIYDTITEDHKLAGSLYKSLVDQLNFDNHSYIIFTPWLTKGGADKYTIEYANTISELINYPVLVIATLPEASPWKDKLSSNVDFLDFGNATIHASQEIRRRLMEHIIENSGAQALHIINSEFGYDFIQLHKNYVKSSNKKVIVTSFSQSIEPSTGQVYGYSHTHVPFVYDIANLITSDNQAIVDMWINEYGFDPSKLHVHHQPMDLNDISQVKTEFSLGSPLRILWAGRIAPEKLPEIAIAVGNKLKDSIIIDMYGAIESKSKNLLSNLPQNINYRGSYDGFDSLDVSKYDVLLYTSLFDGMPNVILESAAAKLPIIASSVGGIPEFIDKNNNGILVTDVRNTDDYVRAVRDFISQDNSSSYANNARRKLTESFSKEQYVNNIQTMLKKLDLLN